MNTVQIKTCQWPQLDGTVCGQPIEGHVSYRHVGTRSVIIGRCCWAKANEQERLEAERCKPACQHPECPRRR